MLSSPTVITAPVEGMWKEKGERRKEEGGMRNEEGGRRNEEGGRRYKPILVTTSVEVVAYM